MMDGSLRVRVSGPLTPHFGGLASEFKDLGYARSTIRVKLQLWAHVSCWLEGQGLGLQQVTPSVVDAFVLEYGRTHVRGLSDVALAPGLAYLRRIGLVPVEPPPVLEPPPDVVLEAFVRWLRSERGVQGRTAVAYARMARPFLEHLERIDGVDLGSLTAGHVLAFVVQRPTRPSVKALRSLLRFLHATGRIPGPLAAALPVVASRRLAGLPKSLSAVQVRALLDAPDRDTPVGRRDFAVLLMLARLGLRCVEIASLDLDDVDWQAGTVLVHGKGNRHDAMPLPVDVGSALASYLQDGRPADARCRSVFVTARAPRRVLEPGTVASIVRTAACRAGLVGVHAHRLRHTVATEALAAGADLTEVGQLLRHASVSTSAIYAKVDDRRLAELARPWPTIRAGAR